MSNTYGTSYRSPSSPYGYAPTPPSPTSGGAYIEPGSVVYTTLRYDGQILYCIYQAEPSSYHTAQGLVHGIQWLLVEVTPILPVNVPPADRDFFAAWGPNGEKERQRMVEKWQREQINRGGPPVKYSSTNIAAADWERNRRNMNMPTEEERRGRRLSSNPVYGSAAASDNPPYTRARSKSYSRYEQADAELLAKNMDRMELERFEDQRRERERRRSMSRGPAPSRGPSRNPSPSRMADYATSAPYPMGKSSQLDYVTTTAPYTKPRGSSPNRLADYTTSNAPPYTTAKPRRKSVSYPTAEAVEYSSAAYDGVPYPTAAAVEYSSTRPRKKSVSFPTAPAVEYSSGATYGGSAYAAPPSPRGGSPYMGQNALPPYTNYGGGGGGPVYPPGHILAGRPIPGMQPGDGGSVVTSTSYRSSSPRPAMLPNYRSSSPRPEVMYRSSSPRPEVMYRSSSRAPSPVPLRERDIHPPASFSRPPSMAFPYTYFDPILIAPDLNRLHKELPALPPVLVPHDVHHDDWNQCINDIFTVWVRYQRASTEPQIPTTTSSSSSSSLTKKRKNPATAIAKLLNVWNASFFAGRGVELMLYRGRQRCSGPQAGRYDAYLPQTAGDTHHHSEDEDEEEDDSDFDTDFDSDLSTLSSESGPAGPHAYPDYFGYGAASVRYGPAGSRWMADSREAHRARKEAKRLKRQKREQRQREKERRRKEGLPYSLYVSCVGDGQPPGVANSAAYVAALSGEY